MSVCVMTACTQQKKEKTTDYRPVGESVIYEVNIRQYTPEGTFGAFGRHLPRLKELGVDVLWLMPVYPISEKNRKGTLGSYYAVKDYRQVNPEFGTLDDLKKLVDQAHRMGFRVVLDWVANHTGWDNPLIEQHPDWYTQKDGKIVSPVDDWTDVADLNYDNSDMREYMIGSLEYWIREVGIDGYRCDMASMVPTDFWEEARVRLDSLKPVFMLAESAEPDLMHRAFDACYGWDLHHLMNAIARGEKDAGELKPYFQKMDTLYVPRALVMNFLDNHDENSWNGTISSRMGQAQRAFAVMAWTIPGVPLIYTGQEAGLDKSLEFFEKDQVDWQKDTTWSLFYRGLNRLKQEHPALTGGLHRGDFRILEHDKPQQVFIYERTKGGDRVVVMLNLSPENQQVNLTAPLTETFTAYGTEEVRTGLDSFELPAWGYRIWVKN